MSAILVGRTAAEPIRSGYYLVVEGRRHWISYGVNQGALNQLLERLYPKDQPRWWIDYCFGPDVSGNAAWSNLDYADAFCP